MPRDLMDNERGTAINPGEAVEEKVSLSDRFGLWLGFHNCGQDEYLAMIEGLCRALRHRSAERADECARARLGRRPRRAFGPRGVAVHSGLGGGVGIRISSFRTPAPGPLSFTF
jgi:predicted AAA+ superfamily ATPase